MLYIFALLAQSGERATVNREAAGSKPARSVLFFLVIAQLVERRTVEVKKISVGRVFESPSPDYLLLSPNSNNFFKTGLHVSGFL